MKQTLRTYIYTLLIIFIPFTLSSLILALLSYFIQYNSFILNIIIEVLSYLILIVSALYFTSKLKKLHHSLIFAFLYFLFSLLIHLGNLHIIHLICKPLVFVIIGIIKNRLNHD
jgi:hypothetical protein